MKRVLSVKRKGFNYYTDYTELYLHRAFENYGYSVVRDKTKSCFSVLVYISETEKYMKMISPFFDSLDQSKISALCASFSEAFKSEVTMSDLTEHPLFSEEPYLFMLSDKFSAYDEPVFLSEELPKLEQRIGEHEFKTNKPYLMSFVNVGGHLSGINITLDFKENTDNLELSDAEIHYYRDKEEIRRTISFIKEGKSIKANIDFLEIAEGVNPKSAVLRAKKRATEEECRGFWLVFCPVSKEDIVLKPTLTITSGDIKIIKIEL